MIAWCVPPTKACSYCLHSLLTRQIEDVHLVREEETGKSCGFAFVKYEDSKSCVLAVDNFVGVKVRACVNQFDSISFHSIPSS
jgi:RNA-binding motif X-linked protein 2